jgi:hypothetical protein
MATRKKKGENPKAERSPVDEKASPKLPPEEARDVNESRGDGSNPDWWKNEGGRSGEVH